MEDEIRTLPFAKIDRCWGLLPLCMFSALILCIFFKNGALFYVAFMEEFTISHQSASWPLNLSEIASHLSGLLVSLLQKKLSIYQIALLGCLLNSASLVASAFVPDIFWMSITLGVLNGLGIGMGILSVSFYAIGYFDKYRATASGFKYAEYALQTFESTVLDYAMDKGHRERSSGAFYNVRGSGRSSGSTDRFRRTHLAALCLIAAAACFLAMPHATKFSHVIATAMTLGFPMGCLLTLKPVLLGDHLGVLRLAVCWGILGIAMLPFAFGGPLL
ncbi:hypothetical protein HPB48_021813 [Haemaphysalis longicornis]|uniref:Monocarboxylate transporter n=1 Tax=Haemaphysalis longicornis TaxID=44386 RepID=A0A9J6GT30_HAELO|nr:hypothetical protein HPB48_021813 [Haemaphysalis longicornis]